MNAKLSYRIDLQDIASGAINVYRGKKKVDTYTFDTNAQALDIIQYLEQQGYEILEGETRAVKWLIQRELNDIDETDDNTGSIMEMIE